LQQWETDRINEKVSHETKYGAILNWLGVDMDDTDDFFHETFD
jgi:hypothetical protein